MALIHYAAGPCIVKWTPRNGAGVLGSQVTLGINREAIQFTVTPQFADVESDDWGGPEGVPADTQFMGATANISLSLSKIDANTGIPDPMVEKLLDGVAWGDPSHTQAGLDDVGAHMIFGEFLRQDGYTGVLELDATGNAAGPDGVNNNMKIVFPHCYARSGGAQNVGTRYMTYDIELEAWAGPGVANVSSDGVLYTKTFG